MKLAMYDHDGIRRGGAVSAAGVHPLTVGTTVTDVAVPPGCTMLDYEVEVAAVIGEVYGKPGASLAPDDALEHIFGYTIFNDWSARDLQRREMAVSAARCRASCGGSAARSTRRRYRSATPAPRLRSTAG